MGAVVLYKRLAKPLIDKLNYLKRRFGLDANIRATGCARPTLRKNVGFA
jgi:hypothetical protein